MGLYVVVVHIFPEKHLLGGVKTVVSGPMGVLIVVTAAEVSMLYCVIVVYVADVGVAGIVGTRTGDVLE